MKHTLYVTETGNNVSEVFENPLKHGGNAGADWYCSCPQEEAITNSQHITELQKEIRELKASMAVEITERNNRIFELRVSESDMDVPVF